MNLWILEKRVKHLKEQTTIFFTGCDSNAAKAPFMYARGSVKQIFIARVHYGRCVSVCQKVALCWPCSAVPCRIIIDRNPVFRSFYEQFDRRKFFNEEKANKNTETNKQAMRQKIDCVFLICTSTQTKSEPLKLNSIDIFPNQNSLMWKVKREREQQKKHVAPQKKFVALTFIKTEHSSAKAAI